MLLFVDESGCDENLCPFSVLAGVAVRERDLWNFTRRLYDLESAHFGLSLREVGKEIKGKSLLKRKIFRHAHSADTIALNERTLLCQRLLKEGYRGKLAKIDYPAFRLGLAAYGQAAIAFTRAVFEECLRFHVSAFLTLVPKRAPKPSGGILRKDYSYLFERYFYFLEETAPNDMGLVVFDELEKSQSHILLDQMHYYFSHFSKGRFRASRIVPVPFFVHSDLTMMIQVADLIAYIANWAIRFGNMGQEKREELDDLAQHIWNLRWKGTAPLFDQDTSDPGDSPNSVFEEARTISSFCYIPDLRPTSERGY